MRSLGQGEKGRHGLDTKHDRAMMSRRLAGAVMQILAIPAALLLAVWLVVVLGVRCTYGGDCDAGIPLDRRMLVYLWLAVWLPLHLLAAGFLAGRLMSRS